MSSFLPRRIYDELVAKASKPKAEQPISQPIAEPITVHVYQHPHTVMVDEKIADVVYKCMVRSLRSLNVGR